MANSLMFHDPMHVLGYSIDCCHHYQNYRRLNHLILQAIASVH